MNTKARHVILWVGLMLVFVIRASAANPIQVENAKLGTSDWVITNYASNREIEGYASLTSVNRGGQIQFFVNTIDPNFTIEIFRTGWYGGTGGRRITSAVQLAGTAQPSCPTVDSATGLIECAWKNPYTLQIPNDTADPSDWASGVYLAKLTGGSSGKQSYIVFVVRDDARASDYLFQSGVNTYQAYNNWGGRSLYAYNSDFQARKVSFNRPYVDSRGAGQYLGGSEYPAVRFLEREGYDVTYATDVDLHENSSLLASHKADLIFGHGEYWSWEIRANVIAARDKGVSLGIFAANTCYWQVRYEPSGAGGVADRTMVGYKDAALTQDPDYIGGNTALYHLVTTNWRANPVNLPEDAFIGVMYGNVVSTGDIVVANASNWVFNSTGLQNGSHLAGLMGDEVDGLANNTPPGTLLLSHSPYQLAGSTTTHYADMTVYTAASGATVFAAGTIIWSWGLDNYNGGPVNAAAQQMTRNLLARFASSASSSSLSSIALNPTSVTGGSSATATMTLAAAAPSGGATVILTSDNTAAQVPPSVTVAAGSASTTFTVTTSSVASLTNVTITGNYNVARTAILTVKPASKVSLASIAVSPTSVTGGSSGTATGTVTLSGAAPGGGATVALTSSNAKVAQVKSSITVNAGAISAAFPVTTKAVASTIAVTITGSYNSASQNAVLTVNPSSAAVMLTPTSLTFPGELVGSSSASQNVTLTNTGSAVLNISAISITGTGAADFKTGVINCGTSLAAGAHCTIPVTFAPVAPGSLVAALSVSDDAVGSPQTVSLAGNATGIVLTSPTNQTSATVKAGQTATYNVMLTPTAFTGNVAITCSGAPAGAICTVSPALVTVSGNTPAPLTVTVTTTARAIGFPRTVRFHLDQLLWIVLLAVVLVIWFAFAQISSRRLKPSFALLALLLIALAGCAGTTGTNGTTTSGGTTTANGTPPGTSTLALTATSGSTQATLPLTLTVN